MTIIEANSKLMKISNVVLVKGGDVYYVTPRTTKEVKHIYEYDSFPSIEEAFEYAIKLPRDWKM